MASVLVKLRNVCISPSANHLRTCRVSFSQRPRAAVLEKEERKRVVPNNYRFVYPEFLPDPNLEFRNAIREKLEQADMLKRRTQIDIPEFYVGSVLAVTTSDDNAVGKNTRFVGICIQRRFAGLRADFTLRNVVDNQGIEIMYEMYDPRLQKVEVLRLEKRPDSELLYLRDAEPEFCTFAFDMEAEFLNEGAPIPVNPIKVKLRSPPWYDRWERKKLHGVILPELTWGRTEKSEKWSKKYEEPWEKFDLMKQYRKTISEEEQSSIYSDVYSELHQLEMARKKMKRRKTFVKPKKTA